MARSGLGPAHGTALYVGAVLGTGIVALPGMAAGVAGPASLVAWVLLVVASVPLAATFAALGARYPDAGGVSTYARAAFGPRAGSFVGLCFYFAIPWGAPAAALIGGNYVSSAVGGGRGWSAAVGAGLIVAAAGANVAGLRISAGVQLVLAAVLVSFLLAAVALALPQARMSNLHPFAPHGVIAIGSASALLVWSFAGWEAITSLAADFRRPERDLPRATRAAVAVVGVVYLSVAWATITVLGPDASRSSAPLGDLLARGMGAEARWVAAGAALLLTFGVLNSYYAGAARLGAALSRDGVLPGWHPESRIEDLARRNLAAAAGASLLSLTLVEVSGVGLTPLVSVTSALLVTVYVVCVAAAVRILPRGSRERRTALSAGVAVVCLAVASGPWLAVPLTVGVAFMVWPRVQRIASGPMGRRQNRLEPSGDQE